MRVLIVMAAALLLSGANAAAGTCCDEQACCSKKARAACCSHTTAAFDVVPDDIAPIAPALGWPAADVEPRPAREFAKVNFRYPVRIGGVYLMGEHVIEHDTDRMKRGYPCTHIYAANNLRQPVTTFHCRHLRRNPAPQGTVTLRRIPGLTRQYDFVEFQFQDSADGHGVPTGH